MFIKIYIIIPDKKLISHDLFSHFSLHNFDICIKSVINTFVKYY